MPIMFEVLFFVTSSGKSPVEIFIDGEDVRVQRKIYRTIGLLQRFGFRLPGRHVKKMTGTQDLWELRVKQGAKNYRFFMARVGKKAIVLLHGVAKKRQKTASKDMTTAQKRLEEYKMVATRR